MAVFRVIVRGEDFSFVDLDGTEKRFGFYATRYVHARSEELAEEKAIELVRNDRALQMSVSRNVLTIPMIYTEEIRRVPWWVIVRQKNGYTFWDMEKEWLDLKSNQPNE